MKKLAFGLMRLPILDGTDGEVDIERVKVMADKFIASGFTYFDTAACYHSGKSEVAFRKAVAERYPRDAYTITDKLSLFMLEKKEDIPAFFDRQLEALGVDYMDIYLLHSVNTDVYNKALEWGAIDFMKQKKREGKVGSIGFSFHGTPECLDRILREQPELEYVQLQINYLDWEDAGVQSRACHEIALKYNKKILIMEPVKGGSLVNISENIKNYLQNGDESHSVASWAVRFAASCKNVVMVLSGMSNEAQLEDNISYMTNFVPLSDDETKRVLTAADMIRAEIKIPCTACRYCTDTCPMNIAIPDYFNLYNNYMRFMGSQRWRLLDGNERLSQKYGTPADCIGCGVCESHCPQNIKIREALAEIADVIAK